MTTYVFPGQGSQVRGMGSALFPEFPEFVQKANDILGYSIEELCLEDPHGQLNKTEYTQHALYVVSALSYFKKLNERGEKPNYLAGHSLGEYNALLAANVFNFETGLKLVQKRGFLMSQARAGGMAAVIGLTSEKVQGVLQEHHLSDIHIANYNSYTQIVISGANESIQSAASYFVDAGAKLYLPLKVSGAFHSPEMNKAKQEFADFLKRFNFASPTVPVIANVTAKPYPSHEVASLLAEQITSSVLWTQTIEYLLKKSETVFEEIGPGKVLAGLIARIQKGQ